MAKPEEYGISVRLIRESGADMYEARVSELPDVHVFSDSYGSAYLEAVEVVRDLQETFARKGKILPSPDLGPDDEFSGRVTLRMSKSLHASIHCKAARDGISLNQWIVEAVASRVEGKSVSTNAVFVAHLVVNQQQHISMQVQPTTYVGTIGVDGGLFISPPNGLTYARSGFALGQNPSMRVGEKD